jgi:hypothetical protein
MIIVFRQKVCVLFLTVKSTQSERCIQQPLAEEHITPFLRAMLKKEMIVEKRNNYWPATTF